MATNLRSRFHGITLLLALALALVAPPGVAAATINAASCSSADVQAAINSAVDGDTVVIPDGTCSWTSGIRIYGKGIKLMGGGSGRIIARSASSVTVGAGIKTFITEGGLTVTPGQLLRVSQLGNRSNFVEGALSSFVGTTLTIDATNTGGSGTPKVWIVSTVPTTVITNDSSGTLIDVKEDTTHNVEISGIKIADGSGIGRRIDINRNGSSGKAVLLHDCWLEAGTGGDLYWTDSNRGVIWNCSFDSSPFSMAQLAVHHQADDITNSWTTPSTMGSADTTGENNLYIEDSDFHAFIHATDFDNNARAVLRHNLFNNAAVGTHGPDTSLWGQRHFEVYDSEFVFNGFSDGTTFPLNHWFFIRGGTFVVTDNIIPVISSADYPGKAQFEITIMNLQRGSGPNPCWGAGISGAQYPAPRQAGFGRVTGSGRDGAGRTTDSITFVGDSEPFYIWNNTSNGVVNVDTSDFGECSSADSTSEYLLSGRDYFLNAGPKPGYAKFTYPHPLRVQAISGRPSAPTHLRIIVP
jgi:hypothetical protein